MASFVEAMQDPKTTKYLAVAFAAMALVYFKDFSDDHALRHVLGGFGFALVAFGTYKNGFVTEARNLVGRYASLTGGAFLIASALISSAPAVSALIAAIR